MLFHLFECIGIRSCLSFLNILNDEYLNQPVKKSEKKTGKLKSSRQEYNKNIRKKLSIRISWHTLMPMDAWKH